MIEAAIGVVGTLAVAIGGWTMKLQGRLTQVETYQQAQKERLDSFEGQLLRRLDRIDEKLDELAKHQGRWN